MRSVEGLRERARDIRAAALRDRFPSYDDFEDADALDALADILDAYQQSTQPGSQRAWYERVLPVIHRALGRVDPARTMQERPPGGTDV